MNGGIVMSGNIILIGLDNGNKCTKNHAGFVYESGFTKSDVEPITRNNLLVYKSFSMDREEDAKVYNILSTQRYKTDYVIKAVLSNMGKKDKDFDKEKIKEALKEAIAECGGITIGNSKKDNDDYAQPELPEDIFNMLDNL